MSDTTQNTETIQDTQANKQLPTDVQSPSSDKVYSKSDLDQMLTKARQQEKDKLYKSLETAKAESESLKKEHTKVQKEYLKAQENLKQIQDNKMSDMERLSSKVDAILQENEALRHKIDQVSVEAETKIKNSELSAYKQDIVKREGVLFPEMITGNSKEEINESIRMLKEREATVRSGLEDRIRTELKDHLPKAISPNNAEPKIDPRSNRYKLSKLKGDEYNNIREKLMAQALESMRK